MGREFETPDLDGISFHIFVRNPQQHAAGQNRLMWMYHMNGQLCMHCINNSKWYGATPKWETLTADRLIGKLSAHMGKSRRENLNLVKSVILNYELHCLYLKMSVYLSH